MRRYIVDPPYTKALAAAYMMNRYMETGNGHWTFGADDPAA
jgi:hypothetical protein